LDLGDEDESDDNYDLLDDGPELSPFVPTSPGELVLAFALAVPSILFLIYLSIVCYRFICSKNYAKWRSRDDRLKEEFYTEIVQEGVPMCLNGHRSNIETMVIDGHLILSRCLGGKINIWDSLTGDIVTEINRRKKFNCVNQTSSEYVTNFLPKRPTLEGAAMRRHLKQRKTKSSFYNKFTEVFKEDADSKCRGEAQTGVSVWCLDLGDSLVVAGCDNGRVEVWDCISGQLVPT